MKQNRKSHLYNKNKKKTEEKTINIKVTQHRAHFPGASVASSELNKLDHYGDRLALYTEIIKMALYINTINKIALKSSPYRRKIDSYH